MGDRQPDRDHSKSHSVSGSEIWPRLEDGQELGVGWNQPKVASLCCAPEGGRSSENNTLRQGVPCGHGSPCPACLLSPSRRPWRGGHLPVGRNTELCLLYFQPPQFQKQQIRQRS